DRMGADRRRRQPPLQQLQAAGFVAEAPPYGPQWVAVVPRRLVLPALLEGVVDVEHGRPAQLQLQVVPGRPLAVAGVDLDWVAITQMVGGVTAAPGESTPADERNGADQPVGDVGHQA